MRCLSVLLTVLALAVTGTGATEEKQPPPRTVSVSGSAVGYVPADTILWNVTLQTAGKDVVEAKAASDEQVKGLTDACAKRGVQVSDIVVGIVRIQDARVDEKVETRDPARPFNVTRIVTVRQRDPRLFSEMLEMLSRGKGIRTRYNVVSSKTDQVTKETIVKATEAAKDKATAMATVLGARLGSVLTINEYPPAGWNTPDDSVPIDQSSAAFGADAERVRITVFVTFELQ
jgi:uncharacterized protein YggE